MRDVAILGQRAVGALEAKTNSPLSCNIQKFASKGQYYKFRPLDAARGGVPQPGPGSLAPLAAARSSLCRAGRSRFLAAALNAPLPMKYLL